MGFIKKYGCSAVCLIACAVAVFALFKAYFPHANSDIDVIDDGTMKTVTFDLPFSSFASKEAREAFVHHIRHPLNMPLIPNIEAIRKIATEGVKPFIEKAAQLYPYSSTKSELGGVPVEIFTPKAGIAAENAHRVLIQLHGGAFMAGGGGPGGAVESIPIVGVGRIKVVAVDYRMGPEHHFPAASEDVAAVYRELLKNYRPENIGIYGCSAGGILTGQSIAWFLKEKLPLPGAIGVFCGSLHTFEDGDSAQLWTRMGSVVPIVPPAHPSDIFGRKLPYLEGVSTKDPLAVPGTSQEVLKHFPPTLFLTGTRAPEMSGAVQSHLELKTLGVHSELLLFDGLDHGFIADPSLPESTLAYTLITRFFSEHLGSQPLSMAN